VLQIESKLYVVDKQGITKEINAPQFGQVTIKFQDGVPVYQTVTLTEKIK
jgi:Cu/Ag efflux pump CusA